MDFDPAASTLPNPAGLVALRRALSGRIPRILVAHANRSMRQLLKLHLVCAGYDVTVAEDAVEAGRQIVREPPDLIVLDAEMPYLDADGLEFVATLQSDADIPLIPVIFLATREEAVERAKRLGATACLVTRLSSEKFLEAVNRALQPAGAAQLRAGFSTSRPAA
jgi:CheY-like chemotaxis protein